MKAVSNAFLLAGSAILFGGLVIICLAMFDQCFITDRQFLLTFFMGVLIVCFGLLFDAVSFKPYGREGKRQRKVRIHSALYAILACIAILVLIMQMPS